MSKSFGLAGLRIGWIATRDHYLMLKMMAFKDYTTICNSVPSEFLAQLALRHRERILGRNLEIIKTNLGLLAVLHRLLGCFRLARADRRPHRLSPPQKRGQRRGLFPRPAGKEGRAAPSGFYLRQRPVELPAGLRP